MNYDDIIKMEHPTSARHRRMPMADRAAQFAPFAALTGYDAMVAEAEKIAEEDDSAEYPTDGE